MSYPLVRDLAADGIPVVVTCRVLGFSPQAFYKWRSSREELRLAIVNWIERTYHRRRRQRGLGKLTPIEYETIFEVAHAA